MKYTRITLNDGWFTTITYICHDFDGRASFNRYTGAMKEIPKTQVMFLAILSPLNQCDPPTTEAEFDALVMRALTGDLKAFL